MLKSTNSAERKVYVSVQWHADNTTEDVVITIEPKNNLLNASWLLTEDPREVLEGYDNGDYKIIQVIAY